MLCALVIWGWLCPIQMACSKLTEVSGERREKQNPAGLGEKEDFFAIGWESNR